MVISMNSGVLDLNTRRKVILAGAGAIAGEEAARTVKGRTANAWPEGRGSEASRMGSAKRRVNIDSIRRILVVRCPPLLPAFLCRLRLHGCEPREVVCPNSLDQAGRNADAPVRPEGGKAPRPARRPRRQARG